MRPARWLIALPLLLSACSAPEYFAGTNTVDLTGKPVLVVVDRLGSPDALTKHGKETTYVWTVRRTGSGTTSYVSQGGQLIPMKSSESILSTNACKLRVDAGSQDNIVRRWSAEGSRKDCQRLLARLR